MKYCNLQDDCKCFWIQHHPHQTNDDAINNTYSDECLCESYLNPEPLHSWALQDPVALELNEYLLKTLTNERFSIGLDPNLHSHDHGDNQYCQELTTYAVNDVLSMQRLINRMKQQRFEFTFHPKLFASILELKQISDDDNDDIFVSETTSTNRIITKIRYSNEEQLTLPEPTGQTNASIITPAQRAPSALLSKEECRRIHNRSCNLRHPGRICTVVNDRLRRNTEVVYEHRTRASYTM
jgi:hypothetical protein